MEFLCPNGHRIQCDDSLEGKAATCPKCKARFEVPARSVERKTEQKVESLGPLAREAAFGSVSLPPLVSMLSASVERSMGTSPVETVEEASSEAVSAEDAQDDDGDVFEFLCPAGHRLHGPRSLQGQPGQCPDCGATFSIPAPLESTTSGGVQPPGPGDMHEAKSAADTERKDLSYSGFDLENSPTTAHDVFVRLWTDRPDGARVTLRCSDGTELTVDGYDVANSRGKFAVFATQAGDGHTITLVPWSEVARITIDTPGQLPKRMK